MSSSVHDFVKSLEVSPLSTGLRKALRLAEDLGAYELGRWCRLELGGYLASNPAMGKETIVPEYRTVTGQHADIYGRVLMLPTDLAFMNSTRLRNGVEELETLAGNRDVVSMHDPNMCDLIQEHLEVQVYAFRFSSVHLAGVFSGIRTVLEDKLRSLQIKSGWGYSHGAPEQDEILELRPNLYGIGVNLRALWLRLRGTKQ